MTFQKFYQSHIGQDPSSVLTRQIERVCSYLVSEQEAELPDEDNAVIEIFHRKGLIPWWLMVALRWLWKQGSEHAMPPTAKGLAVCFASCIFPQRAFQMESELLSLRIARFLELYRQLQITQLETDQDPIAYLRAFSRWPLSPERFEELADDLSGIPTSPTEGDATGDVEIHDRRNGAALYLATCPPDLVARIIEKWTLEERRALHCVTRLFYCPPSQCDKHIRAKATSEEFHIASHLENLARRAAIRCRPGHLAGADHLLEEKVEEFWIAQHRKLTSGFPYFSFQSRFDTWWRQCLRTWDWKWVEKAPKQDNGRDGTNAGDEDEDLTLLTLPEMRAAREGYRFLRYTFSRRSAGEDNEQLRAALDELWFHRVLNKLLGHPFTSKVNEIVERNEALGLSLINNLSNRLPDRRLTYSLARGRGLSNLRILESQKKEKSATFTIASLARTVPVEFTFLWAFTAWIFLRPQIDPQHAEAWDFRRYVRELWHWLTDPQFEETLLHGARTGRRVDQLAYKEMMGDGPLGQLAKELIGCENEADLEQYLAQRDSSAYEREEAAARALIGQLIGPDGDVSPAAMQQWKQIMERYDGSHWIAPVWYVTFVEQLVGDELIARLAVDQTEQGPVRRLAQAMRILMK